MDRILDYSMPVLHPIAVHFPIAFMVAAAACAWIWLAKDRMVWLHASIGLTAAAFAGAVAAYVTGDAMEEQSEGVPVVETLVEAHETLGLATLWTLGILTLLLVYGRNRVRRDTVRPGASPALRWTAAVLVTAAALLVGLTAHVGGLMAWGVAR